MLSASSSNNHTLFSFGAGSGPPNQDKDATSSFGFLPSVNFDDLQSSLDSASTDFKLTQFPSPTGRGSILGEQGLVGAVVEPPGSGRRGGATAQQPATRTSRTGSVLRRPSISSRQVSGSSVASSVSSVLAAPTAPGTARPRRQSHYPPVSGSNIAKPPRKSIGPGVLDYDPDNGRSAQRRRPSAASLSDKSGIPGSSRASLDGGSRVGGEPPRGLTVSRASKARSAQPPPRVTQPFAPDNITTATDQTRASISFPGSHWPGARTSNQPTGSKRASAMPGVPHASHASGLGARTVSPTDARRMKRLSMHQSHGLPQVADLPLPPPPPLSEMRSSSKSPSMIPRMTSTPSSSATTPDLTRKSYSSGLSTGSMNSFNPARTSTGSIQQRLVQGSSSRLPAPKPTGSIHNSSTAEDDEDVPPVPAIPKAYGSPKDSCAEIHFLDKRKSARAFDASSVNSSSTGSVTGHVANETSVKSRRRPDTRKSAQTAKVGVEQKAPPPPGPQPRKNLQPLRLPPITLGPLSTPTAAKIAALQEKDPSERSLTPPPARRMAKTPSTPLTASRSAFFSRNRFDEKFELPNLRSSSSIHHISSSDSPLAADTTSSSESITLPTSRSGARRSAMSPFVSSSLPKGGMEPSFIKRSKTGGDVTLPLDSAIDFSSHKPAGPRAQRPRTKSAAKSTPRIPSPEDPPTPSSISSIRRKLSLSWKRSASKSSLGHASGEKSENGGIIIHDPMPPLRIPNSATTNSLGRKPASPAPSNKSAGNGTYLETRRRKSSGSSITAIISQERQRTDGLAGTKRDAGPARVVERSGPSHKQPPAAQKPAKPTASTHATRQADAWTAELDRDDLIAEEEMKKLGSRRKETEVAARTLDALRKRATPKERVGPQEAIRIAMLNIYERGEIIDYQDIYFCGTQNAAKVVGELTSSVPNFGYDDERGDYTIVPGDHLAYRYEIIDVLGKGSFGQVVRCIDHKTGVLVAVKIIRNKKRFHQQALVEVNILQKLREWDPKNKHSMVNFTQSFYFRGHLCISTELLDMNLYEFIKSNNFRGFSLKLIRRFTKQLLSSMNLLKEHKVIHCDLKPENILLRHPLHSEIKVIDFGSSCFENEKVYTYIQSRFYRSPEVILGMTYGMPIDMWSLGCILAELYTGVPIFPGENEQEQLACIMEVFGPPEKHLIEKSTRKKLFFDSMGKPRLTVSSKGRRRRPSSKTLQQALKCDDEPFLDFVSRCLRWDPDRRLKPQEAICHEFITGHKAPRAPVLMPRSAVPRDASPTKRHNAISAPRPLPDPPGSVRGTGPPRPKDGLGLPGISPLKPRASPRRASAANPSSATTSSGVKRTNTGTGVGFISSNTTSSLPRVAGRSVSARHDAAAAGATAAMSRRA